MAEWVFRRDTAFRKQFFVPDSFAHPAKMDAQLLIKIVGDYTEIGDVILDPMAGSGTTMLACMMGRHCLLIELEEKFCKMCRDNWEIVRMHPQLGYEMGLCQIIQGDARNLEGLLADKIITSPPYAESASADSDFETRTHRVSRDTYKAHMQGLASKVYLGRFKYSGSKNNIGNLPYGQVSKIITSPPFAETTHHTDDPQDTGKYRPHRSSRVSGTAGENPDNIGNLKSTTYLEAMLQVYQQCFNVLKDEGLMILVTKNFIRNKQIVRLDTDTIKLCEQAGFSYLHRHYRKLPSQSFWRILYHKKHPEVEQILYEDILVFKKWTAKTVKSSR